MKKRAIDYKFLEVIKAGGYYQLLGFLESLEAGIVIQISNEDNKYLLQKKLVCTCVNEERLSEEKWFFLYGNHSNILDQVNRDFLFGEKVNEGKAFEVTIRQDISNSISLMAKALL
jgi:hypothetical protein